jgi:uncharacterized damage-inducible protein DinB
MMVHSLFAEQLQSVQKLLQNLEEVHYRMQSPLLGNASIGQHVRHTIELAQALLTGYQTGEVNYDKRKRDAAIETDTAFAMSVLAKLIAEIDLHNKDLQLIVTDNSTGNETKVATNYFRELAYNSEHTIHHMALIRVALREMQLEIVDEQFGVAPSTLKYRQTIMQ